MNLFALVVYYYLAQTEAIASQEPLKIYLSKSQECRAYCLFPLHLQKYSWKIEVLRETSIQT